MSQRANLLRQVHLVPFNKSLNLFHKRPLAFDELKEISLHLNLLLLLVPKLIEGGLLEAFGRGGSLYDKVFMARLPSQMVNLFPTTFVTVRIEVDIHLNNY